MILVVDPRVSKLAEVLVKYSTEVRKGDEVVVSAGLQAVPLIRELVKYIVASGGYPVIVSLSDEVTREVFLRYAPDEVLTYTPKISKLILENVDVMIQVDAPQHTKPFVTVDPRKLQLLAKGRRPLTEIFLKRSSEGKLRWCVTAFPTPALAQEAGMSYTDYEEFVFRACKVDKDDPVDEWRKQAEYQEKIKNFLMKVNELRFIGDGVDLTLKVSGRTWINDDGKKNMPGGEVFSAPIEDSAEGTYTATYPVLWGGYEIIGLRIKFHRGQVIEYTAEKGREVIEKLLQVDEGAKRIGEVAFGLNYDITQFTRNILFDEKIGGTVHIALGSAYPETGGRNTSAIHVDLIADMKRGKVYADGDLVYENGRFVIEVI